MNYTGLIPFAVAMIKKELVSWLMSSSPGIYYHHIHEINQNYIAHHRLLGIVPRARLYLLLGISTNSKSTTECHPQPKDPPELGIRDFATSRAISIKGLSLF